MKAICLVGDFYNLGDAFLAETQALHLARTRGDGTQVTVAPYQVPPDGMAAQVLVVQAAAENLMDPFRD